MHNFKKILLRILFIAAFLAAFDLGTRFFYQGPANIVIYATNDLKESKGDVETLILGTSLMHWGVNGQDLGEALCSTTFNLATAAQPLNGTYYLLKDQKKHNDIKRVFLGVHVSSMTRDYNSNIKLRVGIFDRMLSPVSKIEYLYNTAAPEEYPRYLFYTARIDNVLTLDQVKKNIAYKTGEAYKNNISPQKAKYVYQGMGDENCSIEYDGSFADKRVARRSRWNRDLILPINTEYLQKIADFCHENDIELNLVIMPMVHEISKLMGDLTDMHQYYQDFCTQNNAALYDFYQYPDIYTLLPNNCYQDQKHLNTKGAQKLTQALAYWYTSSTP